MREDWRSCDKWLKQSEAVDMKPMSKSSLDKMLNSPQVCARKGDCGGRLTIEHPFARTGALSDHCIWLCEKHHGLGAYWNKRHFDKLLNKHLAYQQISDEELSKLKMSKAYLQEKEFLQKKFA